ncbi:MULTISPECIES: glycosyltransferase [Clostridia]|jgi:glycosyltransferase involved in cell wall biosynthesis|uniref:glycosyltransferase n=1 Tax=Clostridia TaxID=186801 RepID=UPI000E5C77AC|nr:glycosyltransferase [Eubacterium sp. AF22-9]RGS26837.1 glycosyltransferase [Eubacterium sp. AF22-9]
MIRIDILCPTGGKNGGIENIIRLWTQNLIQDEYDLRVIHMTPGTAYLHGYEKAFAFNADENESYNDKLKRFVMNYAGFIKNYGIPDICIATNWPVMSVVADAVRRMLKENFKIISWVHSSIAEYKKAGLGGVEEMLCADAHFCISRNNEKLLLKKERGEHIFYVGNPVEMQPFISEQPIGKQLCYVGRLEEIKRVDIILEALYRAHNKWKLRIIGSGEEEEELKKITKYLGLQNWVEYTGWKENPWEYCKDACALVSASEYEGFMLTGAEAMSMGLTVISTPVEGLIDYLSPGKNGYLFQKNNASELAGILDYLYDGKLSMCDRKVCRKSVDEYSTYNYFEKIKKILKKGLSI